MMSEHDKNKDWSSDQELSFKEILKKRIAHAGKKDGTAGAISIGYIGDNSEHDTVDNYINPEENKKKNKALEEILMRKSLDEFLKGVKERLAILDRQIKGTLKLRELHKNGELEFDDPAHLILILEAGMDVEDIKNDPENAFEEHLNNKQEELNELHTLTVGKLGDDYSESNIAKDFEKFENNLITANTDADEVKAIQIERGFDSAEEVAIQEQVSALSQDDNLDAFFDDGTSLSFSNSIDPDNALTSKSYKEEFAKAANPNQNVDNNLTDDFVAKKVTLNMGLE